MGLAWTAMGGSTLYVEAASVEKGEGKGRLNATGEWFKGCCQCWVRLGTGRLYMEAG